MNAAAAAPKAAHPRYGYRSVARWIARETDHETYVFRRFKQLSARNLLHLQSDVIELEIKLEDLDILDAKSQDIEQDESALIWETFKERATDGKHPGATDRLKLMGECDAKLRQYHKALLLQSQILTLDRPNSRVRNAYRKWLHGEDDPNLFPVIGGHATDMLEDEMDLVSLKPLTDQDFLSTLLQNYWPWTTVECDPEDSSNKAQHFDGTKVANAASILSTIVAGVLLIGSILILYWVTDPDARLGIVIAFVVLFAASVRAFTSATRDSIFASTAAYAAVLVVFVSGNLGNANSNEVQ